MKMPLYPASVRPDGDTFVVLFPDIPHAHTNGNSREDALKHAPDALLAGISMLMEKGMEIPAPGRPGKNSVMVALPSVIVSAKVHLYTAVRAAGVRKSELARRMGIHKQQVERLMDIDHTSRIEQMESAFAALGMRMVVDVEKAA
jgi:antitoxin HicB